MHCENRSRLAGQLFPSGLGSKGWAEHELRAVSCRRCEAVDDDISGEQRLTDDGDTKLDERKRELNADSA